MPNIREIVQALGSREGVDGVILLGHDGLTIDSVVGGEFDTDSVSALIPSVIDGCNQLGAESRRSSFMTGIIEYEGGLAIMAQLTSETLIAILVQPNVNAGSLLYDLRRHRVAMAELL